MARKIVNDKIEIGDFVEMVKGSDEDSNKMIGWVGILDNEFMRDGVLLYAVVSDIPDHDQFYYATEIKLFKKA